VAGEGLAELAAGGHVPQPRRAVRTAGGQGFSIRAEGHREDGVGVDTATLAFAPWDDGGAMPPFTITRKP
jgi:hypothetical protein